MKILFIGIRPPKIDGKGDQVILYQRIMSFLDAGWEVHLCLLEKIAAEQRETIDSMGKITTVDISPVSFLEGFKSLILGDIRLPLQVKFYYSLRVYKFLRNYISENDIKYIHNILLRTSQYKFENINQSIDLIDSMSLNFSRKKSSLPVSIKRVVYFFEYKLLVPYERRINDSWGKSFLVSAIDNEFLNHKSVVIPIGVRDYYPVKELMKKERIMIGFTGNMSYEPNISAVRMFLEKVWDKYFLTKDNVSFTVVGRGMPKWLIEDIGKRRNVFYEKDVPNMIRYINENIDIGVAPMVSGSGMQFKILEAMAAGKPTVISEVALGDIRLIHKRSTIVCSSPSEYAEAIDNLILDKQLYISVAKNAAEVLKQNYIWDSINVSFFENVVN